MLDFMSYIKIRTEIGRLSKYGIFFGFLAIEKKLQYFKIDLLSFSNFT
jgi:hypothetical protein